MVETIQNRIKGLRDEMKKAGVQAWYISGTDPHQSEYMPEHWQARSFISGFTGSAGLVVVTLDCTALWTDSRYFLQAGEQLAGTGIQLMKQRMPETPEPAVWLGSQLDAGAKVGTDLSCLSVAQSKKLQADLATAGLSLCDTGDLLQHIWESRPVLPVNPVFEHQLKYSGKRRTDKLKEILQFAEVNGANATLLTALDDLAWAFNLRGTDVEYNPVFVGFGFVAEGKHTLFVDQQKINQDLKDQLQEDGIAIQDYESFYSFLKELDEDCVIMLDPARTNAAVQAAIPDKVKVIEQTSAATLLKAQKTTFEIIHIRETMKKDGVAMVNFLYWLNQTAGKEPLTEFDLVEKLEYFRAQQEEFQGNSFYSIVGLNGNGAIVHRSVTRESAASIGDEGMLLFDSGGQYLGGTTDITRTITLGEPSAKQKRDFTLVLKGMIGLSQAKFPAGTVGANLDVHARMHLWRNGLNYGHGTGHGIGYFLNVHEGPMSIRQEYNEQTIKPGMVISNEPGLYREGEYGIRIENVIVCTESEETGFGRFLEFETLTLCPIDLKLVEKQLLSQDELDWLNSYHEKVYKRLEPLLEDEQRVFLKEQTRKL